MHRCPSIEKDFWRELTDFWVFLLESFWRGCEFSLDHPYSSTCLEKRLRHSCSLFSSSSGRPPPPTPSLWCSSQDAELKFSQILLQESEQCCWAHVPKLGQFPHPPAASLSWSSPGTLYYVSCPPPIPHWSASGQLFSAQLGLSADPFW